MIDDEDWEFIEEWDSRSDDDERTKEQFDHEQRVGSYGATKEELDSGDAD